MGVTLCIVLRTHTHTHVFIFTLKAFCLVCFSSFAQRTRVRISNILRQYPDGGQILKELIQNADGELVKLPQLCVVVCVWCVYEGGVPPFWSIMSCSGQAELCCFLHVMFKLVSAMLSSVCVYQRFFPLLSDARATCVRFVFDMRQHKTEKLLSPSLALFQVALLFISLSASWWQRWQACCRCAIIVSIATVSQCHSVTGWLLVVCGTPFLQHQSFLLFFLFQGPAILAYNSQVFEPKDFESIKALGASRKYTDLTKVQTVTNILYCYYSCHCICRCSCQQHIMLYCIQFSAVTLDTCSQSFIHLLTAAVPLLQSSHCLHFCHLQTGRFGIGFNSVYHITDLPSFVTGRHLVILGVPYCCCCCHGSKQN